MHDTSVVDHRVEGAQRIGLLDQVVDLVQLGEVADDRLGAAVDEVLEGGQPRRGAGVHDDLVTVIEERLGGRRPTPSVDPVIRMRFT